MGICGTSAAAGALEMPAVENRKNNTTVHLHQTKANWTQGGRQTEIPDSWRNIAGMLIYEDRFMGRFAYDESAAKDGRAGTGNLLSAAPEPQFALGD